MELSVLSVLFMLVVCIIGAVIQRVTGFGFGIFVMTLFPVIMSNYLTAGAVANCLGFTMNLFVAIKLYKDAQYKLMIVPFIGYSISAYVCISLSLSQSDAGLERLLGIFLVLIALYFMFFSKNIKIKPTKVNGFIAGAVSGTIGGLFGAGGGPPMVIYFMSVTPSMRAYFATTQTFFMFSGLYSVVTRFTKGIITVEVGVLWAIGLISLAIGIFIGKKIQGRLNDEVLRKLVYSYIAVSGIVMAVTA